MLAFEATGLTEGTAEKFQPVVYICSCVELPHAAKVGRAKNWWEADVRAQGYGRVYDLTLETFFRASLPNKQTAKRLETDIHAYLRHTRISWRGARELFGVPPEYAKELLLKRIDELGFASTEPVTQAEFADLVQPVSQSPDELMRFATDSIECPDEPPLAALRASIIEYTRKTCDCADVDVVADARQRLAELLEQERDLRDRIEVIDRALPLIECQAKGESLSEIGASFGMTTERVRRLIARTVEIVRG